MDWEKIFYDLLKAEDEGTVTQVLEREGLLDEVLWFPLGGMENNFSIVGNQQADPTAALTEKVINGIDGVLMLEAFKRGIDPEGSAAPRTMSDAVQEFLGIRDGRLENLTATERTALAKRIQLIAVGSKDDPCYMVVDQGEGQTPLSFPDTFLSLSRSNKIRIPFVQGRFNAGGTGVLQSCGSRNYQLIASRRAEDAPRAKDDETADLWGYTLVRRLLPAGGRKNSMYVYLAPSGRVPTLKASTVRVLPEDGKGSAVPTPYSNPLEYGTVIKVYNYRWRARSLATTEARFELERLLHSPCLPFRVVETRSGYRAHYFATTVSGVWVSIREAATEDEPAKLEDDFPAYGHVDIPGVGRLPYGVVVFRQEVDTRRIPRGVFFTLNGQVHGSLPRDFISREAKLDYLEKHTLVSVDCTRMDERVREDFFMASRDRLRRNEVYQSIGASLRSVLAEHPGLKELNARWRARRMEEALANETESLEAFQDLIRSDPSLAALFGGGERLTTTVGPTKEKVEYKGRQFPTFFRIAKEPKGGLVKVCPENWKCRVDFETDAENDYFDRTDSPGQMTTTPDSVESLTLWNGQCIAYFRPPQGAKPGDEILVGVAVTDDQRESGEGPFVSEFKIRVAKVEPHRKGGRESGQDKRWDNGKTSAPRLAIPNVVEVRREAWADHEMGSMDAIRIKGAGGDEDGYDFYVNMDNAFLITEVRRNKPEDRPVIEYWFKYGLALTAMSILKPPEIENRDPRDVNMETIEDMVAGLARVMVPIIRRLHEGPQAAMPVAVATAAE